MRAPEITPTCIGFRIYDLAFRHEWYSTFCLLAPLPLTARFPEVSLPLWVEVGEKYPKVQIQLGHNGMFVPHHSIYSDLLQLEKYLREPIEVRSPSQEETVLLQLVKQGQAEQLAGRHTKLRFLRCDRERPAADRERREIEARYPPDGRSRIRRYSERPW